MCDNLHREVLETFCQSERSIRWAERGRRANDATTAFTAATATGQVRTERKGAHTLLTWKTVCRRAVDSWRSIFSNIIKKKINLKRGILQIHSVGWPFLLWAQNVFSLSLSVCLMFPFLPRVLTQRRYKCNTGVYSPTWLFCFHLSSCPSSNLLLCVVLPRSFAWSHKWWCT